ncbi:MAG: SUMF1/EgtB/PvdO family nonheme iron enzyme [Verrucomicrobiota bacterium]
MYDMAGNVWQWCWDWHGTPYAGGIDPRGAATGLFRVHRGGAFRQSAQLPRNLLRHHPRQRRLGPHPASSPELSRA